MSEQQAKKVLGKERRRNAQTQKVDKKNQENADYFWKCAQTEKKHRENGTYKKPSEATKEALFARQESSGINFSQVPFLYLHQYNEMNMTSHEREIACMLCAV